VHDGFREAELGWTEVLEDLKFRGLEGVPKLAVGDGALGFWAALRKVFPATREQRCWVHKTANVLEKLPQSIGRGCNASDSQGDAARHLPGRNQG
jgi:transposase-like protein